MAAVGGRMPRRKNAKR